jgi:hypothetical protein
MGVDFEFRNKEKPWLDATNASYNVVKKLFKSGKIPRTKVRENKREANEKFDSFSVDCGGGCWLHIHNVDGYPLAHMSHFDHYPRAVQVMDQAGKLLKCRALNDLDDETADMWGGNPPSLHPVKKSSNPLVSDKLAKPLVKMDTRFLPKILGVNRSKKSVKSKANKK